MIPSSDSKDLADVVSFFVYNFLYLFEVERKLKSDITQNEFARLKTLDIIFNLCLIIDETLKNPELRAIGELRDSPHYIKHGISWLVCEHWQWMNNDDLVKFWGPQILDLNGLEPNLIIPKLLAKNNFITTRRLEEKYLTFYYVTNFEIMAVITLNNNLYLLKAIESLLNG